MPGALALLMSWCLSLMLIVVERRETFHHYYPMGVHPPGDLTVTELWKTFWVQQTHPRDFVEKSGLFSTHFYAAFCVALFFIWYLCKLKPQDMRPSSKITPFIRLRRSRL